MLSTSMCGYSRFTTIDAISCSLPHIPFTGHLTPQPHNLRPVILCIDNRETASELDVRQQVLESVGYGVLSTPSAANALAILRKDQVDLVLMEQGQFGAGSQTLSEAIKRLRPALPVILYSADSEESHEDMRFADFFLTKWASVPELLEDIEEHLPGPCRLFHFRNQN